MQADRLRDKTLISNSRSIEKLSEAVEILAERLQKAEHKIYILEAKMRITGQKK